MVFVDRLPALLLAGGPHPCQKVILRGLLANLDLERWGMLHVAVQIESSVADRAKLEEVTRYFQKYFANSKIDVYWGNTEQFVADLHARWQEYGRE